MKTRKVLSFATAAVMALASLPVLSASAEATLPGDIDQDGFITGHDTAMLAYHLQQDKYPTQIFSDFTLNPEQLALADVNGDGVVDETDNTWIHENEAYRIGDATFTGECTCEVMFYSAYYALVLESFLHAGGSIEIVKQSDFNAGVYEGVFTLADYIDNNNVDITGKTLIITDVQYNLLDTLPDGTIDCMDAYYSLITSCYLGAGAPLYAETDGDYMYYTYYVSRLAQSNTNQ